MRAMKKRLTALAIAAALAATLTACGGSGTADDMGTGTGGQNGTASVPGTGTNGTDGTGTPGDVNGSANQARNRGYTAGGYTTGRTSRSVTGDNGTRSWAWNRDSYAGDGEYRAGTDGQVYGRNGSEAGRDLTQGARNIVRDTGDVIRDAGDMAGNLTRDMMQ